jgi:hypothetical protein
MYCWKRLEITIKATEKCLEMLRLLSETFCLVFRVVFALLFSVAQEKVTVVHPFRTSIDTSIEYDYQLQAPPSNSSH